MIDSILTADAVDWSSPHAPRSALYDAPMATGAEALQRAEACFLRGVGLPARWRGRARFTVAELGFGLGSNFLATWDAWQRDPQRPAQLVYLGMDAHPVHADDLARAHGHGPLAGLVARLRAAWPPRTPGWHRLDLADGLTLLLAWGDARHTLAQWVGQADALYLDAHAPACNPVPWQRDTLAPLARLAAPGATLAASASGEAVAGVLQAAGFAVHHDSAHAGAGTHARFVPAHNPPPAGRRPLAAGAREAVVLGAGVAGACAAHALRRAGVAVRVIDAVGPASGASGNPAGLFHGTVHADDGPHARWNRAAALRCAQWLAAAGPTPVAQGLLRLAPGEPPEARQALARAFDAGYVRAVEAADASDLAGWPLRDGGWFYPHGGALAPAPWVQQLVQGVPVERAEAAALEPLPGGRWRVRDAQGQTLAETGLLVLAAGHRLPELLRSLGTAQPPLPLHPQRGALSWWHRHAGPQRPVAAGGYVLRTPELLLAGATATLDDPDPQLRDTDHAHNRAVAERLLSAAGTPLPPPDGGRVSWRLLAADKLPLVGGLPDPSAPPPRRATQAGHWARRPGLLVLGALASRGLTWAPLAAELGVALALGEPAPVERSLVDAVDPARFAVRAVRKG